MPKDVADRPQTYASPAILARRRRILAETRKMLAEEGISALSMAEIGKRSGVAKRTLYNAFQTREGLVSAAINEYFIEFIALLEEGADAGTMDHAVDRLVAVCDRIQILRNYVGAVMTIYFGADTEKSIVATIRHLSQEAHRGWAETIDAQNQFNPWIDTAQLTSAVTLMEFGTLNDWCHGRLPPENIGYRVVVNYLTLMAGATRGKTRRDIEAKLRDIAENGLPAGSDLQMLPPV